MVVLIRKSWSDAEQYELKNGWHSLWKEDFGTKEWVMGQSCGTPMFRVFGVESFHNLDKVSFPTSKFPS